MLVVLYKVSDSLLEIFEHACDTLRYRFCFSEDGIPLFVGLCDSNRVIIRNILLHVLAKFKEKGVF